MNTYILQTWPLLDGFAMGEMGQASKALSGQTDPTVREDLMTTYRQALNFYKHASELPPVDVESRAIIAKAYSRMGFTNAVLSNARGNQGAPDPLLLKQAQADYRRSLALFESLHQEYPRDPRCRRYFAEALGPWGWGWMLSMTQGNAAAKPYYQRAVRLWREQIRDARASDGNDTEALAPEGATSVLSDLGSLASSVDALANILEGLGERSAAEDVRRQLDDDINALAVMFSAPPARHKYWKEHFRVGAESCFMQENRLGAAIDFRLLTILDPDNAKAHNFLAWAITSVPGQTPFANSRASSRQRKRLPWNPSNGCTGIPWAWPPFVWGTGNSRQKLSRNRSSCTNPAARSISCSWQ